MRRQPDAELTHTAIVFVYDYHPLSTTLLDLHLTPKPPVMRNGRLQPHNMQVSERILWTYVCQLAIIILTCLCTCKYFLDFCVVV